MMTDSRLIVEFTRRDDRMVLVHNINRLSLRSPGTRDGEQLYTNDAFEILQRANKDVVFVERATRNA